MIGCDSVCRFPSFIVFLFFGFFEAMGFSLSHVLDGIFGPYFGLRVRRELVGLVQDYWKDAPPETEMAKKLRKELMAKEKKEKEAQRVKGKVEGKGTDKAKSKDKGPPLWVADRPQILQRMWGAGYTLPGGNRFTDILMTPIGLTSEMSVIDLTAGLGGLARKLVADSGTYVTGYEMDEDLARIGMVMSVAAGKAKQARIAHYDPVTFEADRPYDALVARELFYKIAKKGPFFKAIAQAVKPRGQMAFTDFVVPPLVKNDPEIKAWQEFEHGASPLTLPEIIGVWKMNGFDVRVNEDQTEFYRQQVLEGLLQFSEFLREHKPDPSTVHLIRDEVDLWQRRVTALDHGLKFYRFYAIKL